MFVWEPSFVAMTVFLGAPPSEAIAQLDPALRQQPALVDLAKHLDDTRRAVRAQALASALGEVTRALKEAVLA